MQDPEQIAIHDIRRLEDFQACVNLQKEIWGFDDPYDMVPLPLLIVSQRNDGIVLGAFEGRELIGFVYSLPGVHQGRKVQWSHMLAVRSQYRNTSIGYNLKIAQYKRSQEIGYELIEWTFDPLESKNAYFNLRKLNCIALEYEINIYGETSSPLHSGTPTDRLIAHWKIPLDEKELPQWNALPADEETATISENADGYRRITGCRLNLNQPFVFVEIPEAIQTVKQGSSAAALEWRLQTREAFTHYLHRDYIVYSFYRNEGRSFYVLKRTQHSGTQVE